MKLIVKGMRTLSQFRKTIKMLLTTLELFYKQLIARHENKRLPQGVLASVAVVVLLAIGFYLNTINAAWAVQVDGKQVAVVKDTRQVASALTEIIDNIQQETGLTGVKAKTKVEFSHTKAKNFQLDSSEELRAKLRKSVAFTAPATAVVINNEAKLVVKDQKTAEQLLAEVKSRFKPAGDGLVVKSLDVQETVSFKNLETGVEQILPLEKAVQIVVNGTDQLATYQVVEGDNLWTIARAHNMSVEQLKDANPQLKSELLQIGDTLNLKQSKPLMTVVAEYQRTVSEEIPFETIVNKDNSMRKGLEKVKQEGEKGLKEVTYRIVQVNGIQETKEKLNEITKKEPMTRIVIRGTKSTSRAAYTVASRGSGSGVLSWPLYGSITSGYGYRGREYHAAIDIDGDIGDPIKAAASGTVIFAGWSGGYGKMISIDHGDGLVTRYGHASRIDVKVGDKVTKGEVIGRVGSTGRSTGSHLHFEVLVNGVVRNPFKYLK